MKGCTAPWPKRFWMRVDRSRGHNACWPWRGAKSKGYGRIRFPNPHGGIGHTTPAAVVALVLTGHRKPKARAFACHKCDNPICCNPKHLYWGDHQSNMRDRRERGRYTRDAEHYRFVDLAGRRLRGLVVVRLSENRHNGGLVWICRCDCGAMLEKTAATLQARVHRNAQIAPLVCRGNH
jgi:hypothetical protein